mgnify:CR=1 FL=1
MDFEDFLEYLIVTDQVDEFFGIKKKEEEQEENQDNDDYSPRRR